VQSLLPRFLSFYLTYRLKSSRSSKNMPLKLKDVLDIT